MNHSPLPFKVGDSEGSGVVGDGDGAYITDKDDNLIVIGGRDDLDCPVGVLEINNAEFIVHACNNYEQLVEALREIYDLDIEDYSQCESIALEVLKKAGEL